MRRTGWSGLVLVLLVVALVKALSLVSRETAGTRATPPSSSASPLPRSTFEAQVVGIVDGDTVKLEDGREVRYIGMDCPERGEPFAEEARSRNRDLVDGRRVRFETDREPLDRYRRVLAYAYADGSRASVNETLVEEGLAAFYVVPPNDAHAAQMLEAQGRARAKKRGIWSEEAGRPEPYYVASSGRFHRPDCVHVGAIRTPVRFESRDSALDAGKCACRACRP